MYRSIYPQNQRFIVNLTIYFVCVRQLWGFSSPSKGTPPLSRQGSKSTAFPSANYRRFNYFRLCWLRSNRSQSGLLLVDVLLEAVQEAYKLGYGLNIGHFNFRISKP